MAFKDYEEDQSIRSMSTRQLRKYISDAGKEAQQRIDTLPAERSEAVDDAVRMIINKEGKVIRGTSNMTKAEMVEKAYQLRRFTKLDVESGYAEKTEWQKNKARYESFVRNQVSKSGAESQYWSKYITEKGNVSKRGYKDYKDFISTLKASEKYLETFGYRTIQQYAQDTNKKLDPDNKILNRVLSKVYTESKGKGLTQAELIDAFKDKYDQALAKEKEKKKAVKSVKIKHKNSKSNTNIKVKTTGKMRTSGKVREKLT